jgi:hypothetical protein
MLMAQLTHYDIHIIQTAIEEYEQRFPERPTPSADVALAWRAGLQANHLHHARMGLVPGLIRSIPGGFRRWWMR